MSRATQEQKHKRNVYFAYGAITLWGLASQQVLLCRQLVTLCLAAVLPYNPSDRNHWFGLFRFRSPLLTESRETCSIHTNIMRERNTARSCFLFLSVLRCFTSRGSHLKTLLNRYLYTEIGFPIRIPPDRWLQIASPKFSLTSCVLHRYSHPRHPPCTLLISCAET